MRVFHQIGALFAALAGLWLYRRGHAAKRTQDLRDYSEIRERMDDAQPMSSVDAARGWLHERAKGRR